MNSLTDNYFDLFGLPLSFNIERRILDASYRSLQKASHPDRFINQPSEFQRQAVQQTAQNLAAYQTLKSPVLRACYLLTTLGTAFDLSAYTVTDMDLLMQQMQYREQLQTIKDAADFEQLNQFSDFLQQLITDITDKISKLFEQGHKAHLADLKNHICELQFLNKLALELDQVEEHLMLIQ